MTEIMTPPAPPQAGRRGSPRKSHPGDNAAGRPEKTGERMKIHALALGTGYSVEKLDEMQFPLEQRVRCTNRWLQAGRYTDRALPPAEFLQDLERIGEEGNEALRAVHPAGPAGPRPGP